MGAKGIGLHLGAIGYQNLFFRVTHQGAMDVSAWPWPHSSQNVAKQLFNRVTKAKRGKRGSHTVSLRSSRRRSESISTEEIQINKVNVR